MKQVQMVRSNLADLPAMSLPLGYRLRQGGEEDVRGLSSILTSSFAEPFDDAWVRTTLLEDPTIDKIWLVETSSGEPAATATARHILDKPQVGYVHYVGTHADHLGKRLSFWASLAVLHAFARLGKTSAILDTDDFRLPAIRTYLKLGFEPLITHESHPDRWRDIRARLG